LGVCLPIAGATGASYALASTDYGASFAVSVTAANAAGSAQATSAISAAVGLPGSSTPATQPSAGTPSTGAPPPARTTHTTLSPAGPLRLTHVGLVGKRGSARGQALVFTLSRGVRVQLTLVRAGRRVLHTMVSARRGQNRYWLTTLLRARRLAPGRYVLTVRAGSRTARLTLAA
jgi:hypothetical protein